MESAAGVREWVWRLVDPETSKSAPGDRSIEAFNAALRNLDERPGGAAYEAGRQVAAAWGAYYAPLVEGMHGRPGELLRLFVDEVYPTSFGSKPAAQIVRLGAEGATVRIEAPLPDDFKRGLVEGFVGLCSDRSLARATPSGDLALTWRVTPRPVRVRPWAVAAASVRFPYLVSTLVPAFVALAIAFRDGPTDWIGALLTLVGVLCFQFGSNALNDYYDHRAGDVDGLREAVRRAPPRWTRTTAYVLYGFGIMLGLALVVRAGIEVLWLGLAGFLLGVLYTAPPVRLAYRGLGELAVAIGFGPLIVLGTYFVQRHAWSMEAFLASVPLAFLIAGVLYLHELPDRSGDARVGKRTLIVRLPERPAMVLYILLQSLTYLFILAGVALAGLPRFARYAFPPWTLLGLLTLPLAARATLMIARNFRYPYRLVPTNAFAVRLHLLTGVLFAAGYAMPHA